MEHIPLLIKVDIWLKVVTKKRKEKIHVNERNELRLHHLSLINGDGDITIDDEELNNHHNFRPRKREGLQGITMGARLLDFSQKLVLRLACGRSFGVSEKAPIGQGKKEGGSDLDFKRLGYVWISSKCAFSARLSSSKWQFSDSPLSIPKVNPQDERSSFPVSRVFSENDSRILSAPSCRNNYSCSRVKNLQTVQGHLLKKHMPRFPSHNTVKSLHTQSVAKSHAYHLKPRAGHHQHAKGFGTLVVPQFQNPVDESQAKLTPPHTSQNKTQSFQNLQSSHVKEALCGLENLISFLSFGSNLEVLDFSEQVLSSKLIAAQALILHFEATGEAS
nr:hypothetical protein Iba_chr02cCG8770 [Ipomoea batatas]